ncbi:MAG: hypothetical protein M1428_03010 [Deltaproteobacteria bacterium]|nr:hypothetical protein [Deltaproteobacteria bacterium]
MPAKDAESVFLTDHARHPVFPETDTVVYQDYGRLRLIRDEVNKAIEVQRANKTIGSSLETMVVIEAEQEDYTLLEKYKSTLTELFIVSQAELKRATDGLKVQIQKAHGQKCERCWNYSDSVGQDSAHPTLCARCVEAVS